MKLEIPAKIYNEIVEQAHAEAPIEACGILAGCDGKADKLFKMTNTDKSASHFTMAPKEQFAVVKDIRSSSLQMLAIYHTHPTTPARPSAEDIRLGLTPDVIYVIISLCGTDGPVAKGFLIEDREVTEVAVEITEN